MFWIIFTIILAIAAVVVWLFCGQDYRPPARDWPLEPEDRFKRLKPEPIHPLKGWRLPSVAIIAVLWALLTLGFMIKPVSSGQVGIVRQFGAITGQAGEGIAVIAPWQKIERHSVQTQPYTLTDMTAASSETQDVFMSVTINYSISDRDIQSLIRDVGSNWFNTLVPSRINQYVKQETARWKTIDIIPNREVIRQNVLERLRADLGTNYSITISDLMIDNIGFSPEYTKAIEDKQVATEQAAAAENRTEIIQAEANQARARAQGEADSNVIRAQGTAEANRLITESLTPQILQWQAIEKLADDLTIALIPSGEGVILDPTTLLSEGPRHDGHP